MSTLDLDQWRLAKSFFEEKGLARQHLDSFNDFIDNGLQKIIDEVHEIQIDVPTSNFKVKFGNIEIFRPKIIEVDGSEHPIYPMEARLRNLTYAAPMYIEVICIRNEIEDFIEKVHIGDLPIMVKSTRCLLYNNSLEELLEAGEDPYDPGGYFIINGSERVVVGLEDLAPNRILVDVDKNGIRPIYRARIFSLSGGFRARVVCKLKPNGSLYVTIPGVPVDIPFVILMRALGIKSDKEIAELVSYRKDVIDQLEPSFDEAVGIDNVESAIFYIGNRVAHGLIEEYRLKRAESILDNNLMQYAGNDSTSRIKKTRLLGEMVSRVIELKLGLRVEDDKDHYSNKRLRLAGPLISDLFRVAFRNLCRDMKYQLERISIKRGKFTISAVVRHGIITERIQHALATGNWGRGRIGITQLLDRTNHISSLSHLRRLQSPLSRSQPNFEARDLHSTHWGRLCPSETPEGSNCGLVKNLSLMATISVGIDLVEIKEKLSDLIIPLKDSYPKEGLCKIFIDGIFEGYCKNAEIILDSFKKMRRKGIINPEANISYFKNEQIGTQEIYINCDAGRVRRPLIVIENEKPKVSTKHIEKLKSGELVWSDLLEQGLIEYLDAEEEENAYVALNKDRINNLHTHLEIASYLILGICASIIPYAEHNQSPRNSYEAAMAKQALGIFSTNFMNRVDTQAHILHYAQLPLVRTKPMDILSYDERPAGQNCIVAVLSYEGYNMEDALIFNKSSIERGLARSTLYRVYRAESRQYLGGQKDRFEIPNSGTRGYRGEQYYRFLEDDGIISVESNVNGNDVIIGRTSPPRFLEEYKEFELKGPSRRDTSTVIRSTEIGTVDEVLITRTAQGGHFVKVKVRDERIAEVGDKFASRHGQKGVIGMVVSQEDMPFTKQGIVPDVIINPHTIPSRMAIGQFIESIAGKTAALNGEVIDGTPFSNIKQDEIRMALQKNGFHHSGKEVMYSGITGKKFSADIFIGINYYQKLHHMVADKMHARARGQVQMLTRQPTEGRARGGGLRFGEMERDCLIGHGAALLLKDRLLEESDKAIVHICEKCGYISYFNFKLGRYVCKICGEDTLSSPVVMSYAFKLLLQELMSLCISPKLLLSERN